MRAPDWLHASTSRILLACNVQQQVNTTVPSHPSLCPLCALGTHYAPSIQHQKRPRRCHADLAVAPLLGLAVRPTALQLGHAYQQSCECQSGRAGRPSASYSSEMAFEREREREATRETTRERQREREASQRDREGKRGNESIRVSECCV